jgi:hypothetical protein
MSILVSDSSGGVKRADVINPNQGAQNGLLLQPNQWAAMTNYVRQPILSFLISPPALLRYLPNPTFQLAALKSMIEVQPQKIDGLKSSVTWDFDGPAVGHSGEKMESVIKANREVSAPNFEWTEKVNQTFTRYWTNYGQELLMHPDTQRPGIISAPAYLNAGSPIILAPDQGFVALFIEPDNTLTRVVNAWLCSNMQPRSGGEIVGRRETGGGAEVISVPIEFTAWTMNNEPVVDLATRILDGLRLQDLRPVSVKPFENAIDPYVRDTAEGLARQLTEAVVSRTEAR